MTDYEVLRAQGHSAQKAAEIILDAMRGDDFCKNYIALLRSRLDPKDNSPAIQE